MLVQMVLKHIKDISFTYLTMFSLVCSRSNKSPNLGLRGRDATSLSPSAMFLQKLKKKQKTTYKITTTSCKPTVFFCLWLFPIAQLQNNIKVRFRFRSLCLSSLSSLTRVTLTSGVTDRQTQWLQIDVIRCQRLPLSISVFSYVRFRCH